MDPLYIIILMLSACSLLIVLFFIIRKKSKKQENPETTPGKVPLPKSEKIPPKKINIQDLDIAEINTPEPGSNLPAATPNEKFSDLIELVKRYNFFQGKNLDTFTNLLLNKDFPSIEKLILEKFISQGKGNAETLAHETSKKLLASILVTGS